MPAFDFDAFIEGLDDVLPRYDVPLYRVNNEARIALLEDKVKAAADAEPGGDDRISSRGPSADLAEIERLRKEQEDSATMFELRALSADEYDSIIGDNDKDLLDQIVAQMSGTRNPLTREQLEKVKSKVVPGSWHTFTGRANEIIVRTAVMPDFSLSDSQNPSPPTSSAS